MLAGTSRGVFRLEPEREPEPVLHSRGVRDLMQLGGQVFAGTGAGLYVSADQGRTWSAPCLADREVWQIRQGQDGRLWAGTQPAGLFVSDDEGKRWREVASFAASPEARDWCVPVEPALPARARALVIDSADPARLCVGVEVGGVMRSEDGGGSWTLALPGNNPDLHVLAQHPAHPEVLFASTGYGRLDGVAEMVEGNAGVFRSGDFGAHWDYVWRGITPRYSRPMCIDPRPPHALTVASAPTAFSSFKDEQGAGAVLFRSDDLGGSWRALCEPSKDNFHGLTWDPDNPGGVLVGTDTGQVCQVSAQGEWQDIATGLPAVLAIAA